MRALGISTLAVQTTGISGQAVPKIRIEGMEYSQELRELIRSLNPVSEMTGVAGRSQGPGSTGNHRPKAP
jgi:hypothetical protein